MSKKQKINQLIWFTTNLRTNDNKPLAEALKVNGNLSAVYCLNPKMLTMGPLGFPKMNVFRLKFLLESLKDLEAQLHQLGIPFTLLLDDPINALPQFFTKQSIDSVYMQKDWTTEEKQILQQVRSKSSDDINWNLYFDQFLIAPQHLPFSLEILPEQFTTFRKKVEKRLVIQPEILIDSKNSTSIDLESKIPSLSDLGFTESYQDVRSAFPYQGGSKEGHKRLHHYFWESDAIQEYKETRNGLVGTDYSSKFSAWLAMGCLSPKSIYYELKRYEKERHKNQSTYWLFFELLWRDYFKYISLKHHNAIFHASGIQNKSISWKQDIEIFQSWVDGKTDSDFVNANMLELKHTGWMSNRGRQNVASYLTKTLGIDWRWGASYFESMLIDYDVHSNYGNWIYIAGVGNDPRDRIFNVDKQAEYYDPQGDYRNLWLSEESIV